MPKLRYVLKRKAKNLLTVIIICLALILFTSYITINGIIKSNIELFGSHELQAQVTLDSAQVNFFPLGLTLNNLKITKNDESDPLKQFSAKRIIAYVDHNSLFGDRVMINYLVVYSPQNTYDTGKLGFADIGTKAAIGAAGSALLGPVGLGIGAVAMGVKAINDKKQDKKQPEKVKVNMPTDNEPKVKKQFFIKQLYVKDALFIPAGDVLWIGKGKQVKIPDIEVNNIDQNSGKDALKHVRSIIRKTVIKKLNVLKGLAG